MNTFYYCLSIIFNHSVTIYYVQFVNVQSVCCFMMIKCTKNEVVELTV